MLKVLRRAAAVLRQMKKLKGMRSDGRASKEERGIKTMFNNSFWPAVCAFTAVVLAMLALVDFILFVGARYRERYLQEAGAELDDVLIQMPPSRVFDLGIALAVCGATIAMVVMAAFPDRFSFMWAAGVSAVSGGVLFPIPRVALRIIRKRRQEKFNYQLEDALGMISSSLKAGFSINQALEEVAAQDLHPLAIEFRLMNQEIHLGVPLEQAMDNMCRRLECDDLDLVATAIITARQTGGELTGVLERVAALIRERIRISRKVKALTAMGRMQAIVIGAMPFMLLAGLAFVSPRMFAGFFDSPVGFVAMGVVTVLVIAGFAAIKKITTIEV